MNKTVSSLFGISSANFLRVFHIILRTGNFITVPFEQQIKIEENTIHALSYDFGTEISGCLLRR